MGFIPQIMVLFHQAGICGNGSPNFLKKFEILSSEWSIFSPKSLKFGNYSPN